MGHRFLGALTRGPYRKFSGSRPPSRLKNRGLALPVVALLAALTLGLLFLLPGNPLHAQEATTEVDDYAENGTDPVVTFTAVDPEGRTVYWSLLATVPDPVPTVGGAPLIEVDLEDQNNFSISMDGVLTFKSPPDFEMMMGGGSDNDSNTYRLVVVSSDDAPGAGTTAMPIRMAYHKVTVMVTDEDEGGSISLSAQQPQVGVALTATLTDQDARSVPAMPIINAEWTWERAQAMDGPWTLIPGAGAGATAAAAAAKAMDDYTPTKETDGDYLRATVTYTDKHGSSKTAMPAVSAHAVRAEPSGTNSDPTFPTSANTREVDENSPPGTLVGDPVKANDTPGETLTYVLFGNDAGNYTIDAATGQLRVGARGLDDADTSTGTEPTNTVTVWAMDPSSAALEATDTDGDDDGRDSVEVTITIENVNEAPMVSDGLTKTSLAENFDSDTAQGIQLVIDTYMATDVESTETDDACDEATTQGSTCTWSLEGDDESLLEISNATDVNGQLSFKNAPDFENPADADMDNVYEVTVKVTDSGTPKMSATRYVMITVTNANETGMVTFSSVQPKVGRSFTATLNDPDGMTTGLMWEWMGTSDGTENDPAGCSSADSPTFDVTIDEDSDSYTPKEADLYQCLQATASYTDPTGSTMAIGVSANAVIANTDNVAPEFREGGNKPVMQATRKIEENSVSNTTQDPNPGNVGEPVAATDPNGGPDTAEGRSTYTLGGADKDSFEIDASSGQITVGADTELDYESNKKTYMVTVTATDPSQAMATIAVTIMVTNINDAPEFTAPSEGDVDKTVQENARSLSIYTFQATDPERRKVYWSLSEDAEASPDSGQFTISDRGALSLNASPDYEGDGLGVDKQYMVAVVASDDAPGAGIAADSEDPIKTSMKTVTVTVTDMEETGTITLVPKYPHVATAVAATLTDGDGTPNTIVWEWTAGGAVVGTDAVSYTPVVGDVGKTLRVKASYTEDGEGKVVGPVPAGTVREAPDPANEDPAFEDTPENNARKVAENARVGTRLGNSIRATDTNNDTLTYTVNNANFSVSSSGQLSTAAMLNHEDDGDSDTTTDGDTQTVTITATDPWGGTGTIEVNVTVEDVNETPMINSGPTRRDRAEGIDISTAIADYDATDVDDGDNAALTWSLEGDDAAKFNIVEDDGMLTFKESPNYEMPADRNKDNVYKVTVVVSDDGTPKLMDNRQVEITVTDAEEEGTVTLSAVQPKTGIDLMASLTDPDNVTSTNTDGSIETGVTWQWQQDNSGGSDSPTADCSTTLTWVNVPKDGKSASYTPTVGDVGKCLRPMASYPDRRGSGKSANMPANNAVIVNTDNVAPMFKENDEEITETTRKVAENAKPNAATDDPDTTNDETMQGDVGNQVMATDANTNDLLTYTLSGNDRALFEITSDTGDTPENRGGQISLKTGTKLDYEDRTTYMVTVTAADPDGEMASVDVTIKVTDVNEAPEIMVGGLAISSGPTTPDHVENSTADVGTYAVVGSMKDSASWTLTGNDASNFMLQPDPATGMSVMLMFKTAPDHEMPGDANMDNYYMVTLNAVDSEGNMAMRQVTVRVTNMDEDGMVTFWRDGADATTAAIIVGDMITAAAMDPDGNPGDAFPIAMNTTITSVDWQWAKHAMPGDGSMPADDSTGWMDIGTNAAYTVVAADENYYLRAMAMMYADGHGSGKMAMMTTTGAVTAVMDMPGTVTLSTMQPRAGTAITAMLMDADVPVAGSVTWQWSSSDAMDGTFTDIDGATMASYTPVEADEDMYLRATAMYNDGHGSGKMAMMTTTSMVTVTAVMDIPGTVSLSTMQPRAGMAITATLMDTDVPVTASVMWQWASSDAMDGTFTDIDGATMGSYTPRDAVADDPDTMDVDETDAGDIGMYLRATAMYDDGHGMDKMAYEMTASAVVAEAPPMTLLERYDINVVDGMIDQTEVEEALYDYFFLQTISQADVEEVLFLYFFP